MDYKDQPDLLTDEQKELGFVDPAEKGLRFANYLVDQIILIVLLNVVTVAWAVIAKATGGMGPEKYLGTPTTMDIAPDILLGKILISFTITVIYYAICEAAMNGRTIGKLVTGTIAITQDGTPFTFKHALLRSICRGIPFEPLSGLGYLPWHDKLTKTVVVRKTW